MTSNLSLWATLLLSVVSLSSLAAEPPSSSFKLGNIIAAPAPVTGPAPVYDASTVQWANSVLEIIRRTRLDAISARNRGELARAASLMLGGLERAATTNIAYRNGPFTAKAVCRGVDVARAIAQAVANERNGPITQLHFLFAYYDFIERVAAELDFPHYIPYLQCGRCQARNPYDDAVFEKKFVDYAKLQLDLVLTSLAQRETDPESAPVTPIGSPYAFLTALTHAAWNAATDLQESTQASRYANVIGDARLGFGLLALADRIQNGPYADIVDAVVSSYGEASSLSYRIEPWCNRNISSCYSSIRVLSNSVWIGVGQTVSIPMGGIRQIRNVSFDAEAIGSPATLYVYAKGVLKGKDYIPARDPNYVVTIEEWTESVELYNGGSGPVRVYWMDATTSTR